MRFQGKVALVTGAASGIGEATAQRLADEGAAVIVNDLDPAAIERTVASLAGTGHLGHAADVGDPAAVAGMLDAVADRFGGLDVLVSNAAVSRTPGDGRDESDERRARSGEPGAERFLGQVPFISDDGWQRMLDVNLSATFLCVRAGLPLLVGREGAAIVCVSSVAARAGMGPPHYTAAKAGMLGLVRSLALSLAPAGIRANAVCPGAVDTPMNRAATTPVDIASAVPLGRVAAPSELAACICFLASSDSSYVTGHTLDVNGGQYLN